MGKSWPHICTDFLVLVFFFMISGSADRLPRLSRIPVMANHCSGPLHLRFHWRKQLLSGPMEQQKAGQLEGSLQVSNQIPLTCFFVNSQYFHDQPTKWVFSYGIYTCVSWRVFIYSILTIRWLRNFHVMGAPWFQDLGVAPNGNIPQIIDFSLSELEQAEYLWATLSKLQTTAEGYATHSTSPTQWKQHSFPTVPCFWIGSSTSQTSHRESGALTKSDLKHIVRLQEVQYNLGFSICWYTIYVDMILIYCIRYTYIYIYMYVDMYWITEHIWTHSYILHADHWPPLLLFTGVASSTAGFSPGETMPLCSETSLSLWRRNPIPNMAGVDRRAKGAKIKREGCSKAALLHDVHQVDAKGMLENFFKKECSQED